MSNGKEGNLAAMNKVAAEKLRKSEQVYVLFSQCTRMPYVVCDDSTYDDEILLYFQEEAAKNAAKKLLEKKEPVQALKIEKKDLLTFFVSLMPLGVNCILINQEPLSDKISKYTEYELSSDPALIEIPIQLDEIIRRKEPEEEGKVLIENPQFHLTALYFMQKVRKNRQVEFTEEIKELHEEMMAHYQKGKYIIPVKENAGTLVMKQKDGQIFQPVFTDIQEYKKFLSMNREGSIKTAVLPAEKIPGILAPGTIGVAVNPFGVNLQLQMKRRKQA